MVFDTYPDHMKFHMLFAFLCFAAGLGIRVAVKPEFRITPPVCLEFNILMFYS